MADIVLEQVTKRYPDGALAVDKIDLEIADGEFVILVGPSGCGKSTTLNMIAGLEDISDGELRIGGKLVNNIAPKDRDIAMVFQSYALYPHMTVRENMAFALKLAKTPQATIDQKVDEAARVLDALGDLLLRHLLQLQAECDVLVHGEVRVERVALEDHRDVAVAGRHVVHHLVADLEHTLRDVLEPGHHAQRRRLSATRRTDEHHELAVLDLEIHVVHGSRAVRVDLAHPVERDRTHRSPPFARRGFITLFGPFHNEVGRADCTKCRRIRSTTSAVGCA